MEPTEETLSSAVYTVAVRLPPFRQDWPAAWFTQAEVQFELAAITRHRTKFNHVVSQLNQQQAAEVEDIIASAPEHKPYDQLKTELLHSSTSREQRVRQLLSHEEMGDRKPSQLLRHLKSLAPDVPDNFLRTLWASRLQPHVHAILAGQTGGSLDSISNLADRICDMAPQPTTASVSPTMPNNTDGLLEQIEELSRQVASLQAPQTHSHLRSRDRRHLQSRDCRSNPNASSTPHKTCWYYSNLTLCRSNLNPYCLGRKAAFFSVGI
jgi:hypothetical protein